MARKCRHHLEHDRPDFIVGSDVAYDRRDWGKLLQSIDDLAGPNTKTILGVRERVSPISDLISYCMTSGFACTVVHYDQRSNVYVLEVAAQHQPFIIATS